jgi:putative acetyltransferase
MKAQGRMRIRFERPSDAVEVRDVNVAAFGGEAEADLVEALRRAARPLISLVAEEDGAVAGHILFSPVTLSSDPDLRIAGLAPMAVSPKHQRQGIGSALVRAGLDACRSAGFVAVAVLGHSAFYPRFGFVPASRFGIASTYAVADDVFMALELNTGALRDKPGVIHYHSAFAGVT